MPASTPTPIEKDRALVPMAVQIVAWIAGLAVCVAGMLDLVPEWDPTVATVQLFGLAIAPLIFMLVTPPSKQVEVVIRPVNRIDWCLCFALGLLSFGASYFVGIGLADLPPAYHDEFSYLFEAKTLLAGRFSYPSHPTHPELFDQMHVLNEGRMASRYYPGTSLWLAPFVAIGRPYLAAWIASSVATMLLFWTGRELAGRKAGFVAASALALSPGVALFGTTSLAHQPTLMSLSLFLLGVSRWRRTRGLADALAAGCGLSFAMICRPMTAAAMGMPFGIDVAIWLIGFGKAAPAIVRPRVMTLIGFGVPLIAGWSVMAIYNQAVTGDWTQSPYQVYTDIYTPRHVYGFNNRVRGEQHLGPKVIEDYDDWAQNLTPELAAENVLIRWIASWLWSLDIMPLLVAFVIIIGMLPWLDRRWTLIAAAILSLHVLHAPYWYVGIMAWHYVFETVLLWCLIVGGATTLLTADWVRRGAKGLSTCWYLLLLVSVVVNFQMRVPHGLGALKYPRQRHAELRRWIEASVQQRPALVLIEQKDTHLDLVVNEPGLQADLLLGRYRPGKTDVQQIRHDFPERSLYVASPDRKTIERIP